jgi:hypothetical protein
MERIMMKNGGLHYPGRFGASLIGILVQRRLVHTTARGLMTLRQIVRVLVRLSAGVMWGSAAGAAYASLVAAAHLGVRGRWDHVPIFAAECVLAGALLGLVASIVHASLDHTHRASSQDKRS